MVKWLGHQTHNLEIPGSSPALTTSWISSHQLQYACKQPTGLRSTSSDS